MATIHSTFSKSFNRRYRQLGPFWQGRYKAKLLETPNYLQQLVLYIHLNPVSAGIVESPHDYPWSGHRELVKKTGKPLVDVDQLLLIFDETRRSARRLYLAATRAVREDPWLENDPGALPWWRFGRPANYESDDDIRVDSSTPTIDELGRSTAIELPKLKPAEFINRALHELELNQDEIAGRTKRRDVVRAREMLIAIGVERYGLRVKDLADELGVKYDTASLWGRRGAKRRTENRAFAKRADTVVAAVASLIPSMLEVVDHDQECTNI